MMYYFKIYTQDNNPKYAKEVVVSIISPDEISARRELIHNVMRRNEHVISINRISEGAYNLAVAIKQENDSER